MSPPTKAGPSEFGWHSGDETLWRCEQEFVFKHLRNIAKAGIRETPRAKAIGLMVHAGRARWFAEHFPPREQGWDSIYEAVRAEVEAQPLPIPLGAEQEALNILTQYVDHYGKLPKPKVLAAELELGPLTVVDGSTEKHTIRLDDLSIYSDFANSLGPGECKTTSGKPMGVYQHYNANHGQLLKQMLVVTKAIENGTLKVPKEPIGVILDVIQKGYGGDKCHFERFLVTIEAYQLEWFSEDLEETRVRRRELEALEAAPWRSHPDAKGTPSYIKRAKRNPTACRRLVSGDGGQFIAVDCDFLNLCKYGRGAATEYTVNGQPAGAVASGWWK